LSRELDDGHTPSSLRHSRGDSEAHRGEERVEVLDDPLVQAIELLPFGLLKSAIAVERL
jgi:hypothetical protein